MGSLNSVESAQASGMGSRSSSLPAQCGGQLGPVAAQGRDPESGMGYCGRYPIGKLELRPADQVRISQAKVGRGLQAEVTACGKA